MSYVVRFAPEARSHLDEIERFIAAAGSRRAAADYVDAIVEFCAGLATFPLRGVPRDDLHPGLRLTHYKSRAVIAYIVDIGTVMIVGVFYGGRRIEGAFDTNDASG